MTVKIKQKLRAGSNRSFLARDFEGFRLQLIEQARIFFPDKIKDFSEPSVAGLLVDLAASVGDTMSFYLDHQFKELDPQTAVELGSIETHLRNAGIEPSGASPAVAEVRLSIKVPAALDPGTGQYLPKTSTLPVILAGSSFESTNGIIYNLTEDLDFAERDPLGNIVPDYVTSISSAGIPQEFQMSLTGIAISGTQTVETVAIPDIHVPFREIKLANANVSDILSVKDSDGNTYYEVNSLSQDTVYIPVDNTSTDDFDLVSKTLEIVPATRRFVKRTTLAGRTTAIRFGSGDANVLDDDIIPDPSELSLELYGKKTFSKFSIDPGALIGSQTLGMSPRNTTLTINYRHGGGQQHNTDANTITTIANLSIEFRKSPTAAEALSVRQSASVTNPRQATGGMNAPEIDFLRSLIQSSRNSQARTVTREDLLSRIYSLPAEFGRVFRVGLADNPTNPLALLMYVTSLDRNGNLAPAPDTLKENLSTYLNEFRLISDAIDVLDCSIINYGISYEVMLDKTANKQLTLQNINRRISDSLRIKFFQIDQPLIIDDILNLIINTEGVISLVDLQVYPLTGEKDTRAYSVFSFPFESSLKNGILRGPLGSIFELKFPENDIVGHAI
tara:strand:+ start:185 stop:2035 length:1851 start_codon:yes stop_codon:yes gene_type:complete